MTLSEWYKAGNHLPNMAKGGKAKKSTRRVSDDPIGDFLNNYEMEKLTKGIAELDAKIKDLEPVPTQVETGSDPMLLDVYPRLKREMEADPHLYEYGTADKKDPSFRRPMLRKPAGRPDDVIPDRLDNDWLEYQLRPRGQTDFSDKLPPGMELPIGKVRSLLEDPSEYYAKGGEVSGPKGFGLADVAPFVSPVSMKTGGQARTRAGTIAKPTFIDEQLGRTSERLSKLATDPQEAMRDIAAQYFPSPTDSPEEQQRKLEELALGFTGNIKPVGGISATAAKAAKGKKAAPAAPTAEEARATASAGLSPEESKLVEMFGNKQKREAELTRKVKKQAQAEPKVKGESKGKRSAVQPDFYRKMQEDLGEEAVLRDIRSGQHLKQDPYGGYIGAPRTVSSPQALGGMRKSLDQQFQDAVQGLKIADPERMGTWYDRAKAGVAQSTEPFQLPRVLEEHGVYSAGVAPESELGFALKHRNSRAVGQPEMAYRGAPMRTLDTAVAQDRPAKMGFKIGEYANKNDPRIPNTGLFGVNDFRAAQGFGYTTPAGDIWTGGVSPTMHPFMDAETALVVDRANKAAIGGRSDWQGPHIQELPWVLGKAQDLYSRGKTGRFAGEPIEGISAALREANKTAQDYMYKHAAAGTHEAIPGQSTGHVPGMLSATPEEKIAYSQEGRWDQPTPYTLPEAPTVGAGNRDVLYSALNMRQLPSEPSVGAYRNMAGEYEFNPMTMARPLLDFPTGGKGLVAPQTLKTANAVERFRAIMDAQEAGALNLPNTMGAVKGKNSIVLDSRGVNKADPSLGVQPTQEQMIALNKELEGTGYGASATGRGVTIFPFDAEKMGSKEIQSLIKKKGADFQRIFPSKLEKSLNSSVYVPGIGKWGEKDIVPTTPFSGEATSGFLEEIAGLPPKVALDIGESEGVRGSIRKKIARDAPLPGAREDIQNMRKFFAEADWPKAVALIRKGLTPAAALASMGYSLESMAGEKEPLR